MTQRKRRASSGRKVGSGKSAHAANETTLPEEPEASWLGYPRIVARVLLLVLVACAPWFYAMATWNAQLVLCGIALLLVLIAFCTEQCTVASGALHRCFMIVLLFVGLQTVPFPESISGLLSANQSFENRVSKLAGEFAEKTQLDESNESETLAAIGRPKTISVAPTETRQSLAVLGAACAILWAGTLLFQSQRWQLALLAVIAISGSANALLGVVQVLLGDWTLLPSLNEQYFSTFVNRNSAPQFYAIALGAAFALIVWWFNSKGSSLAKKYGVHYPAVNIMARLRRRIESLISELDVALGLLLITIVILFAAVFASASRGGILACALASMILMVRLLADYRASFLGMIILVSGVIGVLLLAILGIATETSERLTTLSQEFHQLSNVRLALWQHVLEKKECWLLGSGFGTFHLSVLDCDLPLRSTWFYHAENLYVEIIATLGVFVFVLIAVSFSFFVYELMTRAQQENFLHIAMLPAVCAVAAQSMVDFSLILPGVFIPFLALAGSVSNAGRSKFAWTRISKKEGWVAFFVCVFAILYGISDLIDATKAEALARQIKGRGTLTSTSEFEVARQEQLKFKDFVLKSTQWPSAMNEEMRGYLARPEVFVAAMRGQREELPYLAELAKDNPDSMDYLRSTADPMARTLADSPMDWRASWGLLRADLQLLTKEERLRNLARLYRTAGHKPELLADIGSYLIWLGDKELGLEFWRKAIRKDFGFIENAEQLVPAALNGIELHGILPDEPFLQIESALRLQNAGHIEDAIKMYERIDLESAQAVAKSSQQWRLVANLADRQNQVQEAALAFRRAANKDAANEKLRFEAARALFKAGMLAEAQEEITRALRRSPNNRVYRDLDAAIRKQIDPAD